jgi:hypothetical protein
MNAINKKYLETKKKKRTQEIERMEQYLKHGEEIHQ